MSHENPVGEWRIHMLWDVLVQSTKSKSVNERMATCKDFAVVLTYIRYIRQNSMTYASCSTLWWLLHLFF